jgi:cell division protein FtsW
MVPEAIHESDDDTVRTPAPVLAQQTGLIAAQERGIDLWLLGAIMGLLCIGTVEIYSASAVNAGTENGTTTFFLLRHLVYLVAGATAMFIAARIDYGLLRRYAYPVLVGAFVLLVAVLVGGATINGAKRWFRAGPLSFQPVEIAKLALVVYLASSLARKREKVKTFTVGFMPHLVVCALMMGLLLKQPDLGSSMILGATTLVLLFVAGTKLSYILVAVLAAAPVVYHAVVGTPWRLKRMIAFLDPWQFRQGVGYQITESLISIGSGGLTGMGLGEGKQKLHYMPEAHSDFIMSNIGEELGFIGFVVVIALYLVILWRGVRAALGARDTFGTYLAFGLTSIFVLQALVNTGVVLGALPAKGLTLPFLSYGGTSLVVSMFFAGILLNVSKRAPAPAIDRGRRLGNEARLRAAANKKKRRPVVVRLEPAE